MRLLSILLLLLSAPAFSWIENDNVSVESIAMWENADTANPLYFKLSSGTWCYIPAGQKFLQSTILALYLSKAKAMVHCYDTAEALVGGVAPAYKMHRIIAK